MDQWRTPVLDSTLPMLLDGYTWLPGRWRETSAPVVRARVLGRPAVGLRGPDAVRFFYDDNHVHRRGALPEPVVSTLFGRQAVHTLDGEAHRIRKALFTALLAAPAAVNSLTASVVQEWELAVEEWSRRRRVVLFTEASRVLTRGVCRWAGVPVADGDVAGLAADLVSMVDGFATLGPRHWRARLARARREKWLAQLVEEVRSGAVRAPAGSAVEAVATCRDYTGQVLSPRTAAVELLNVVRPTAAVSWFVAFTAHALHRWPVHRERLRDASAEHAIAFAHEVRRFYPFAPFVGGLAAGELTWRGEPIPPGALVLLDLYGQNHDETLWEQPYRFDPDRFAAAPPGRDELVAQGGADPRSGHRCPGEDVTTALLAALAVRLARLDCELPPQDLGIPLNRVPTRPRSGVVLEAVRPVR